MPPACFPVGPRPGRCWASLCGLGLKPYPVCVSYHPHYRFFFGSKSGHEQGHLLVHGLLYVAGLAFTNSTLGVVGGANRRPHGVHAAKPPGVGDGGGHPGLSLPPACSASGNCACPPA